MSTRRTSSRNPVIITSGPKRRIERIFSKGSSSVSGSVTTVNLHTAEDAKTLVSSRGRLIWRPNNGASSSANVVVEWVLAVAPGGTTIFNPSSAGATDQVANDLLIARGRLAGVQLSSGSALTFGIGDESDIVTKAMRKLKENDIVQFLFVGSSADGTLTYTWDNHFKE